METRLAPLLIVVPSRADGAEPRVARSLFLRGRGPSLFVRLRMTAFGGRDM
jgi:hypothetical protein